MNLQAVLRSVASEQCIIELSPFLPTIAGSPPARITHRNGIRAGIPIRDAMRLASATATSSAALLLVFLLVWEMAGIRLSGRDPTSRRDPDVMRAA